MLSNTRFNCYSKQEFCSRLRTGSGLLVVSFAVTSIMFCCYVSSNNGIGALTEEAALINDQVDEGETPLSYYSSIFSNLSRGLPIDEGVSNSESVNEQVVEPEDSSNPNPNQEPQQQEQ